METFGGLKSRNFFAKIRPRIFLLVTFFLILLTNLYAQNKYDYVFVSPNKNNAIIVRVDFDRTLEIEERIDKDGDVFIKTKDLKEYMMFSSFFRYRPKVIWLSNDLAEVFIGTGSPGFFKRYIRVSSRIVSPQYYFAVIESPDLKNIIVLDMDTVKIYRLFEKHPFKTFSVHGLRPWGNEVKFISVNRFYIKNDYLNKNFYIELEFNWP